MYIVLLRKSPLPSYLIYMHRAVDRREVAVRKKLRGNAANLCEQLLTLLQKVSENAK